MRIKTITRAAVLLLLAGVMLCFSGCHLETIQQGNDYVDSVKRLVDDTVKYTRDYKEEKDTFNCREAEKSKTFLASMDSLIDCFQQIMKLQATDEFDRYDAELKESAKLALQEMSQLKSLAAYSVETGDDTFYQNDVKKLYEDYSFHYEQLKELSAEIQTYWRNA